MVALPGRRPPGGQSRAVPEADGDDAGRRIPAAVLGTAVSLGLAIFLASAIGLIGQTQRSQLLTFVVAFGILLPIGSLACARVVEGSGDGRRLVADSTLAATVIVALLGILRLAGIAGVSNTTIGVLGLLGGLVAAGGAVALTLRGAPDRLLRLADLPADRLAVLAAAAFLLIALIFAPREVSAGAFAGSVVIACGVLFLAGRLSGLRPASGKVAIALDLAVIALIAMTATDITGYWGQDFAQTGVPGLSDLQLSASTQVHQHFYLGSVNDILHGRALLVDANSVYGIGNAYTIALWFKLVPFGYGTFGLLGSLASALVFILGWWIIRTAGVGRLASAVTMVAAVMLAGIAPITSPTLYINVGGMRFGPAIVILAAALARQRDGRSAVRSLLVLAVFGYFCTWSIEAITYCVTVLLALMAVEALRKDTLREAALDIGRSVLALIGAFLVAHAIFALATLIFSGELPDWSEYLALFRAWGEIVGDVFSGITEPWSRAWFVGAIYTASAIGVIAIVRGRGRQAVSERTTLAIAGLSGTGVAYLSYFAAHSRDVFLPYIALPAVLLVAIWTTLAMRTEWRSRLTSPVALASATLLAALTVAGTWGVVSDRFSRTPLAHLIPGGPSLREDLALMWNLPVIDPRTPIAVDLIDRYFPGDEALVLTEPDLGQEALIRSGRANLLPISYPWQDEVYLDYSLPPVEETIDNLEPGTPILLQDPIAPGETIAPTLAGQQAFGNIPAGSRLGPLAQAALDRIEERFRIVRVTPSDNGIYVGRLEPRGDSTPKP